MKKKHKKNRKLKPLSKNIKPFKQVEPNKTKSKDTDLQNQLKESEKKYLYLKADFENFKKQSFKEKQEMVQYASAAFIKSFVENVLDDLERALQTKVTKDNLEEFQKGIEIILKKLHNDIFKDFGVEVIDPIGKAFDPSYQEALSKEKTSRVAAGCVSRTFKKAYKLKGKVIRPAQVVVAEETLQNS